MSLIFDRQSIEYISIYVCVLNMWSDKPSPGGQVTDL